MRSIFIFWVSIQRVELHDSRKNSLHTNDIAIETHDWCMQLKSHINYWIAFIIQSIGLHAARVVKTHSKWSYSFAMSRFAYGEWMRCPFDCMWWIYCREFCARSFSFGWEFSSSAGNTVQNQMTWIDTDSQTKYKYDVTVLIADSHGLLSVRDDMRQLANRHFEKYETSFWR